MHGARGEDTPSAAYTLPARYEDSPRVVRWSWVCSPDGVYWDRTETESDRAGCWDARTAHRGRSGAALDSAEPRSPDEWAVARGLKTTGAGRGWELRTGVDMDARRARRARAARAAGAILREGACGVPVEAEGRRMEGAVWSCRLSRLHPSSPKMLRQSGHLPQIAARQVF